MFERCCYGKSAVDIAGTGIFVSDPAFSDFRGFFAKPDRHILGVTKCYNIKCDVIWYNNETACVRESSPDRR